MRTSSPGPTFWPDFGGLAVHGDAPGEDHLLHRAARAEAARRQHLVQALRLGEDCRQWSVWCSRRRQALRDLLQRQARLRRIGRSAVPRIGLASASGASAAFGGASGISSRWEASSSASGGSSASEREAEIVEEGLGRRVERRASRRLAMADDLDPLPVLERLDDVRGHGDAADGFDVAAGDGLLIGDDRQGFHHRARIARRLFRREPVEIASARAGSPWKRQPRRDLHELDLAAVPVAAQLVEQLAHGVRRRAADRTASRAARPAPARPRRAARPRGCP